MRVAQSDIARGNHLQEHRRTGHGAGESRRQGDRRIVAGVVDGEGGRRALPPESKANDPVELKTTEVAGVGRGLAVACKDCSAE